VDESGAAWACGWASEGQLGVDLKGAGVSLLVGQVRLSTGILYTNSRLTSKLTNSEVSRMGKLATMYASRCR
jgi:hypothetical protein